MRISINVKTINEPFGGANNFAKNLSKGLMSKGYYVTNKLNSAIYELLEDGDIGDEIGEITNGKVNWH